MTDQTKPSAGALRAAEAIKNEFWDGSQRFTFLNQGQMTEIIDRETGLASLLKAAKDAPNEPCYRVGCYGIKALTKLKQAIAKVEGR